MAEGDEEKTETPTEKKRQDTREKGTVAKSTELNSVIVLLTALFLLKIFGKGIVDQLTYGIAQFIEAISITSMDSGRLIKLLNQGLVLLAKTTLPIAGGIMIMGVVANVVQIGFLFTLKPLAPKLEKINPISGFGRLFSMRSMVETVKNVAKLSVIGVVAYLTLKGEFDKMLLLSDASVVTIFSFTAAVAYKIILRIALVLVIIAALDFAYQRYDNEKKMKMSHQEIKEERKQLEGDPQVKSRIRSLQREMARRRMMDQVPQATVVVTNPTYIAIAMRYDQSQNDAPIVVAKGKRIIAERIKTLARENHVPIIEDKPLARAMYEKVDVGSPIPMEFFTAVAEILAYVYRLKNRTAA